MQHRPKISLPLTTWDLLSEAASLALLVILWVFVIRNYALLPDVIPVHFNATGQVDRTGNKSTLFSLPIIATVIYFGMTALNRFSHFFNCITAVTAENAARQYRSATRMLRLLKLAVVLIFFIIVAIVIQTSIQKSGGPGPMLLPVLVFPFLMLTGWAVFSVGRRKRSA